MQHRFNEVQRCKNISQAITFTRLHGRHGGLVISVIHKTNKAGTSRSRLECFEGVTVYKCADGRLELGQFDVSVNVV